MTEPPPPATKRLPAWEWCLTLLAFPSAVFIAYGFARIIKWPAAIVLALLSLASIILFARIMEDIERGPVPVSFPVHLATIDMGMLMIMGWCLLLYNLGNDVGYWTPGLRHGWRMAKRLGIFLLCVMITPWILMCFLRFA